jgi:NADPH-dependent 2,4-dienoyl-CoA reductase/sulfur reductase-like enzyme
MAYDVFDRKHEIIVAGSGLLGWAAAMTAARAGRKVLLVSRRPNLGWEITSALADTLSPEDSPLAGELLERLVALGAARDGRIVAPAVELVLERMAEEAGIELLLYATPLAPVKVAGRVAGILVGAKDGQHTLRGDLVVDATDNRLPAREAGLPLAVADTVAGRSTIVLNLAGDLDDQALGDSGAATGIALRRSVWPGEILVTYNLPTCSPIDAQLAAPDVLDFVHRNVSTTATAMVTTMSTEPLPLEARVTGAGQCPGLVTVADTEDNSPAARIALGETLGAQATAGWSATDNDTISDAGALLPAPAREASDVVVAGGGTGGALAAIAAARQGARTTVIEPLGYLGGIGTGGGIHSYYHGVTDDLQDELDARVAELSPRFLGGHRVAGFHPDAKKVALMEMATRAGVEILLGVTATGVTTEPVAEEPSTAKTEVAERGTPSRPVVRLTSVQAAGPDGPCVLEAAAFVDATGDGDVAAMAGAEFNMGRQGDGLLHAFSQSAGHIGETKDGEPQLAMLNFDAGYVDPDDVTDMSRARRLGLKRLWKDAWTAHQRWTYIAPHLGLRQGRQIIGDYQLTLSDEIAGARSPDVVVYAKAHYDNHFYDYENESDAAAVWVWLLGQWRTRTGCEVPYRCLLPRGVEGLVIGCRALSLTQDAHYQLRMQRDMQRVGIAAGIAAAMAAKAGTTPRAINVPELQAILTKIGALRETDRPQPALSDHTTDELIDDLATGAAPPAVWQLAFGHNDAADALRETVRSGPPAQRFWSAAALAITGDKAAVPELVAAVRERRDETIDEIKTQPKWLPAIVLLGRIGDPAAVPALVEVLADGDAPLSAILAAIRALGRIGDASAKSAVRQVLTRDDLDTERFLQFSMGNLAKVTEDARWQFELACAETLAQIGKPDTSIARKYLTDDRAYVRRLARRVLAM